MRSALARAVLAALLGLPPTAALAQQSSGGLYGSVAAGVVQAGGGAQVIVRNTGTNAVQIRPLTADGKYSLSGLSPGEYEITLMQANRTLATATATVRPGSSSAVAQFGGAAKATTLDGVQVTGARINNARDNIAPIDVSTPELVRQYSSELFRKTGVDTSGNNGTGGTYSNLLTALPGQFMSQVESGGTSGYASFGGASGTETRYYVNEFDTTYDENGSGSNMVPGELVGYATVISNGASAKYSNAMGGSVAAETKSGDNTWRGGVSSYIVPPHSHLLRPLSKNYLLADGDGKLHYKPDNTNGYNGQEQAAFNTTLWISGPLVQDRLFLGLAYQINKPDATSHYVYGEAFPSQWAGEFMHRYKNPASTLKWNITENQALDLVLSRNRTQDISTQWELQEPGNPDSERTWHRNVLWDMKEQFNVARYRWHMNDSMDLSLMGGYFTHQEGNQFEGFNIYAWRRTRDANNANVDTVIADGSPDSQTPFKYHKGGLRADWVWQLDEHKIGVGAERYQYKSRSQGIYGASGHYSYFDYKVEQPTQDDVSKLVIPANTPYLRSYQSSYGGTLTQTNRGAYLEDYWQALDNLVVYAGVRRDNNRSRAGLGQPLNLYTTSPRLGLSWDINGDSSMKLGFTWGRYAMAVNGFLLSNALNEYTNTYGYYTYDGINPDGTPINPKQFASYSTGSQRVDPRQLSSRNLKTSMQENWGLYFQDNGLIENWTETVELNYASVKRAISVWRDLNTPGYSSPGYRYLQSLGYADPYTDNVMFVNPGRDIVLTNDFNHDGKLETVTIPAGASGLVRPKRETYTATIEFIHPETEEQPFFLDANFTWKHSWGNWEGYYAESDPAANILGSPLFQYASLLNGATGNLPQDIPYTLTINSAHTFANGFGAGLGFTWLSGPLKHCYSQYPDLDDAASTSGWHAFYCDGKPATRGSVGRLASQWYLGVNLSWERSWGAHKLRLELGVDNLFNRTNTITYRNPYYGSYDGEKWIKAYDYNNPSYMYPRFAHLGIYYNWN